MTTLPAQNRPARMLGNLFVFLGILTWGLIAFGALVRARQAGLSCPDWPLCHGVVLPDLGIRGVIYEFGHRVLAGGVALLFAAGGWLVWRHADLRARLGRWLLGGAGLLLTQIVFGGLTVLIVHRGDGDPRPATWTVATHLLLGNSFAALALLIGARLRTGDLPPVGVPRHVRWLALAWSAALLGQFVLGGSVAGSLAGLVCTEFPTCNGGIWFPAWTGPVGLQVLHRLNAYLLVTLGITLFLTARRLPRVGRITAWLAGGVVLQAILGAANVLMYLRADVTTTHSLLAAMLFSFTALLWATLGLRRPSAQLGAGLLALLLLGCTTQGTGKTPAAVASDTADTAAAADAASDTPVDALSCNGSPKLCDRRFSEITLATSHNGMSNKDEGWAAPNQDHGLLKQLDDGIRGFMIDVHPYDGDDETLTGKTFLCHESCLLGAEDFAAAMTKMRMWLDAHPDEVISFIYEDYVPETAIDAGLATAGMLPMCLHVNQGQPFPTLREMIQTNRRVFIMTESGGGALPWNHGYQTFAWDTNYHFEKPADFSCAVLRGKVGNPLFVVNHFITNPMASITFAEEVNHNPLLIDRAEQCEQEGKQLPNYLAVDFYDVGDVVLDAAKLNGIAL